MPERGVGSGSGGEAPVQLGAVGGEDMVECVTAPGVVKDQFRHWSRVSPNTAA